MTHKTQAGASERFSVGWGISTVAAVWWHPLAETGGFRPWDDASEEIKVYEYSTCAWARATKGYSNAVTGEVRCVCIVPYEYTLASV